MILRLAPLLAFLMLGSSPFWIDEVFTVHVSRLPVGEIAQQSRSLGGEVSPPLYYLFLHLWLKLGHSEAWARLPSALAAAATAWVVAVYANRHWGRTASIVATLLMCTSTIWLKHAQEARMYGFVMLFSTTSILSLRNLITTDLPRPRTWLAWAAANALLCAVSFAGLYVAGLSLLAMGIGLRQRFKHLAIGLSLLILSLLPMLPVLGAFWSKVVVTESYFRVNPGILGNLVFLYLKKILFPMSPISPPWHDWTVWTQLLADLGFLVLLSVGLAAAWRNRRTDALFWSLWILSPLPVAAWASAKGWMFEDRVITYMIPIVHIVAALGAQSLWSGRARRTAWIVCGLCMSLNLPIVIRYFTEPRKEWRRVVEVLSAEMNADDALVATGVSAYALSYYFSEHRPSFTPAEVHLLPGRNGSSPCRLYTFRSPGRLLILDGFIVPCGMPFVDTATAPLLSSTDLENVIRRHPRTWIVIETGNQGIPLWRDPWKSVLDGIKSTSKVRTFGAGEGVLLLEASDEAAEAFAVPFDIPVAVWPGGSIEAEFRVPESGTYTAELLPLEAQPRSHRLLLGEKYARENVATPLEVHLIVDGLIEHSATFQPDGTAIPAAQFQLEKGTHVLRLILPPSTEQILLDQQRSLPVSRLRMRLNSTPKQADDTISP